ncbi:hypothetical protein BG011_005068 [Mortierella polycephala]|uniref:Uncharacterized protein n=1 Tax=Mortierella polycephala TaxID=41804 RepID=A0A9P6PWJ2_9FUNG|nr:hypothetical protein BG011_005068 [Mortierella polycephala]
MAHGSQDHERESVISGIDRLEKAISQLAASIATERTQTTIETKHVNLPPQPSSTVSEVDKTTKFVSPASTMQPPQMMEQEITSSHLMRIQARLKVVGKTICDIAHVDKTPSFDQLSAEAKADPGIMTAWHPNVDYWKFCNGLSNLLKVLQGKEEEERNYLRGLRKMD